MSNIIDSEKEYTYTINNEKEQEQIFTVARALASKERIKILHLIDNKPLTISEIANILNLPKSTVAMHTLVLQEAQLIFIDYKPGPKGQIKLCSRLKNSVTFLFDNANIENYEDEYVYEMPIGNYFAFDITPPCGMAGISDGQCGPYDEIKSFCEPTRFNAELLWFQKGYITYRFPILSKKDDINEISFSLELCSETVYYRNDFPSDITFWINDVEIATYNSPGDFGGRRGKYSPSYWFINSTQFGILKTITVNENGVYTDNIMISKNININNLHLNNNQFIEFKIGIKENAIHKGGINIFGKNFGDYNQAIVMKIEYKGNKTENKTNN